MSHPRMTLATWMPLCCAAAVACAAAEPPPPVPNAPPARSLPTPTLSALAGAGDAGEPAEDGCGAGCLALECRARRLEQAGDPKDKQARERERAGILSRLYSECCRTEPSDPACKDPARVTRDIASAYRGAGDEAHALLTELSMLNPHRFPKSEVTERVKQELGERAEKIESAVRREPTREGLGPELVSAVRIRFALGDEKAGLADAAKFRKLYAAGAPVLAADIELEVGANYARTKKFALLSQHVTSVLPKIKQLGRLELELRARALSARAAFEQKQRVAASAEIASMLEDWSKGRSAFLAGLSEPELSRAGQALTAVGEAMFLRGEEAREKADALLVPRFAGARDMKSVQAYLAKDFKTWMAKRRSLIDTASRRYRDVLDLTPSPPPKWVVHSAARTGQMLETFAAEFSKVPVPIEIERDPDLARVYRESLDSALEPQVSAARAAFRTCQSYARRYDHEDELSQKCDEWLAQHPGRD